MALPTKSSIELAIQQFVDSLPSHYRDIARQTFVQHGFKVTEGSSLAGWTNAKHGSLLNISKGLEQIKWTGQTSIAGDAQSSQVQRGKANSFMSKAILPNTERELPNHPPYLLRQTPKTDGNLSDSSAQHSRFFFETQKLCEDNQRLQKALLHLIEKDHSNQQNIRSLEHRIHQLETQIQQSLYAAIDVIPPLKVCQKNVRSDHVVIDME